MKYLAVAPFYFAVVFLDLPPKKFLIVLFLMFCVDMVSHIVARIE